MLGLALVAAAHLPVLLAPVIAALATAAGAPYLACASAVTPRLVRGAGPARGERGAVGGGGGLIAGPALGGVLLLATGSTAVAFVVNALTFAAAAMFTLAIGDRRAFDVVRTADARRAGLFSEIADGAAALRAHPAAVRLVSADILCSLVYGMQTVLLVMVARNAGLGMHGYGYLFAAIGAGGLAWHVAGRAGSAAAAARLARRLARHGRRADAGDATGALGAGRAPARGTHRGRCHLRRGHDGDGAAADA